MPQEHSLYLHLCNDDDDDGDDDDDSYHLQIPYSGPYITIMQYPT